MSIGYGVCNLKSKTTEISMHINFDEFDELTTQRKEDDEEPKSSHQIKNEQTIENFPN